jgi:protein gp37
LIAENWVEDIRAQCRRSGTAFFFKQWGGRNKKAAGRLYRGWTWDDFPAGSLTVRNL